METKLRDILMTHAAAGADRVVLEERIVDLQATVAMVSSHRSLVRALFTDIRNVLVGTAGNFVASSAIQVLNQMLGIGVPAVAPNRVTADAQTPGARCDHPQPRTTVMDWAAF
jgi:hypothetical protein